MKRMPAELHRFVKAISRSGLTIYDPVEVGDPDLWIPTAQLEALLDARLRGVSVAGLPLRTRSKVVKQHVCRALGYPVPTSFKRTQPRFPGQLFDTHVQKANNLQVWNEELAATRRYVLIRVSPEDVISEVKVVTGSKLATLDTTGTLTQKYQARCIPGENQTELVAEEDTEVLAPYVSDEVDLATAATPISQAREGELLPIATILDRLEHLVGESFHDAGYDQERVRGGTLHQLVCAALGYDQHQDDGQFPDLRHQLLEVKLQTSPTIDLGLVQPDGTEALDAPRVGGRQIRYCDVRYAVFYAETDGECVTLTHLFVTTGAAFFTRFPQFGGRVLNKKLQIPLPRGFFET
jgi:hypothetical protein